MVNETTANDTESANESTQTFKQTEDAWLQTKFSQSRRELRLHSIMNKNLPTKQYQHAYLVWNKAGFSVLEIGQDRLADSYRFGLYSTVETMKRHVLKLMLICQ